MSSDFFAVISHLSSTLIYFTFHVFIVLSSTWLWLSELEGLSLISFVFIYLFIFLHSWWYLLVIHLAAPAIVIILITLLQVLNLKLNSTIFILTDLNFSEIEVWF